VLTSGGAGDRLARAERAIAAQMPATRVALDERTGGWNVSTDLIPRSFNCLQDYARCSGRCSDRAHNPSSAVSVPSSAAEPLGGAFMEI
jgi:hypothetical protein